MKIHLVSYATPRFRHRQVILAASALANKVADRVWAFSPAKVSRAGFSQRCPELNLNERGSGFWAWKPFIISKVLAEVPDGDVVFYCDVGRSFPLKQLTRPVHAFLDWMDACQQEVMPGVLIPASGPMSMWTKRDAFVFTGMDRPEVHAAAPVQASFSLWKAGPQARALAEEWLSMAARRELVSDDPGSCGINELPDFRDHRHDQSLLTLCCLKQGIQALDLNGALSDVDAKEPSLVAACLERSPVAAVSFSGKMIDRVARTMGCLETKFRGKAGSPA